MTIATVADELTAAVDAAVGDEALTLALSLVAAGRTTSRRRQAEAWAEDVDRLAYRALPLVERALDEVADRFAPIVASAEPIDSYDTQALTRLWQEASPELLELLAQIYTGSSNQLLRQLNPGQLTTQTLREAYLTTAQNRLSLVGDDLWNEARQALAAGTRDGEGYRELRERLRDVFKAGGTELGPSRALRIARTEVQAAVNRGTQDAVQALPPERRPGYKTWLAAAGDSRTRPAHAAADNQTVGIDEPFVVGGELLMYPGDPAGSAGNTINCVVGSTEVDATLVKVAMRSWYEGELIVIRTAAGETLSITPNHPVLTRTGWKPAGELVPGDHCVSGRVRRTISDVDEQRAPTQVSKLFDTSSILGVTKCEARADFHGERRKTEINVVGEDWCLGLEVEPASPEELEKFELTASHEAALSSSSRRRSLSSTVRHRHDRIDIESSSSVLRRFSEKSSLPLGSSFHPELHGLGPIPRSDTSFMEDSIDDSAVELKAARDGEWRFTSSVPIDDLNFKMSVPTFPSDDLRLAVTSIWNPLPIERGVDLTGGETESLGDLVGTFTLEVELDEVLVVNRVPFYAGHVYNLATVSGWYTGNRIILHNCRCAVIHTETPGGRALAADLCGRGRSLAAAGEDDDEACSILDDESLQGLSDSGGKWSRYGDRAARISRFDDGLDLTSVDEAALRRSLMKTMNELLVNDLPIGWSLDVVVSSSGARSGGFRVLIRRHGKDAGYMLRKYDLDERTVENFIFKMEHQFQGQGIGEKILSGLDDWYVAHGFERTVLNANIDVGGYAWARRGYDWDTKVMKKNSILDVIRGVEEHAKAGGATAEYEAVLERATSLAVSDPAFPTPYEVSRIGWTEGAETWPGKQGLLGSNWYGTKPL